MNSRSVPPGKEHARAGELHQRYLGELTTYGRCNIKRMTFYYECARCAKPRRSAMQRGGPRQSAHAIRNTACMWLNRRLATRAAPGAKVPRVSRHVGVQHRQGSLHCRQRRAGLLMHLRGPGGCGQRPRGRTVVPVEQQDAWPRATALSRVPCIGIGWCGAHKRETAESVPQTATAAETSKSDA